MGEGGVLTSLIKGALEAALEGEIEAHISQNTEDSFSNQLLEGASTNRCNGKIYKTMHSGHGTFELVTPRDRNSTFEPQAVQKR